MWGCVYPGQELMPWCLRRLWSAIHLKGRGAHGACGLWWSAAPERGIVAWDVCVQELGLMSPVRIGSRGDCLLL